MSLTTNEYFKLITKTPSIVTNSPEILFNDPDLKKVLQQEASRGNFDSDVLEKYEEMEKNIKRQKVEEVHHYSIRHNSDGRYATNVLDETRPDKRRTITAYSERDLYVKLYDHYFGKQAMLVKDLFDLWMKDRESKGKNTKTLRRHLNHWNLYYIGNPFVEKRIEKVTYHDIENFLQPIVPTVTKKEFFNMSFIIKDMLKFAKHKELIVFNPMNDVDIDTSSCLPPANHDKSTRIYQHDEMRLFEQQLAKKSKESPNNIVVYAIYLLFQLGLRIGELVALKWEDISQDKKKIHITRMEETYYPTIGGHGYSRIVEHTKKKSKSGDRYLHLDQQSSELLKIVQTICLKNGYGEDGYIFCNKNGRITRRAVDDLIRKTCQKVHMPEKSAHDIRRTVASILNENGISDIELMDFLGHSDIRTTREYIYNSNEEKATGERFEIARKGLVTMHPEVIIPVPQRTHERTHTYTSQNKIKIAKVQ